MAKASHKFLDRSKARELSLEYLYQWFLLEKQVCDTPAEFVYYKENISAKGKDFARKIIAGVIENIQEIEKIISITAKNWSISRMIIIDRIILCIGAYEILFLQDIPDRVSINEAIELAKKYSSVKSFAFVNGILDKISKREIIEVLTPESDASEPELPETTAERTLSIDNTSSSAESEIQIPDETEPEEIKPTEPSQEN